MVKFYFVQPQSQEIINFTDFFLHTTSLPVINNGEMTKKS